MADSETHYYRQFEGELESALTARAGARPSPEIRALCLAAAAAAHGRRHVTRSALKVLLARGTGPDPLREILLQTYLFAGYPRAINALAELAALVERDRGEPEATLNLEPGVEDPAIWRSRGEALCRRVYRGGYDRLLRTMARISPDLGRWMVLEGYGKVLSRPAVDPVARELAAAAALMTLDVPDQLRAHLRGALFVGASREDLEGALETAALIVPEALPSARRLFLDVASRHA